MYIKKTRKNRIPRSKPYLVLYLVLALVIIFGALEVFNVTHVFHKEKKGLAVTTSSGGGKKGLAEDPASSTDNTQPSSSSNTAPQPTATKQQNSNSAGASLLAPSGTFANVYKGVSLSETMSSTCNTTPGATCQIIFTSGSLVRSLPAQVADGGGSVIWSWHPNDQNVGLSVGTWHITAKATLGSQTKTADNGSLELEIVQ